MRSGHIVLPTANSVDELTVPNHEIVTHLNETSPLYAGLDRNEADRIRGYLLARSPECTSSAVALPFIREELEVGDSPFCVAAAARALSRLQTTPDWAAQSLLAALQRFLYTDDSVSLSLLLSTKTGSTTVLLELIQAFSAHGPSARTALPDLQAIAALTPTPLHPQVSSALRRVVAEIESLSTTATCCSGFIDLPERADSDRVACKDVSSLRRLRLEDQNGNVAQFGDIFSERINMVAFFYTRCMNPAKCSAMIEKLGSLQKRLGSRLPKCRIGAITYDPAFDTAARLLAYGANRNIDSGSDLSLLRCIDGITPLASYFELGVGFGETTVNRHRTEVFFLDSQSNIVDSFIRRQFTVQDAEAVILKISKSSNVKDPVLPL